MPENDQLDTNKINLLDHLPHDIRNEIEFLLDYKSKHKLSASRVESYFGYGLNIFSQPRFLQILLFSARANLDRVRSMLTQHPAPLLLQAGEVLDYPGRKILGSLFQCALGAQDFEMYTLIATYFDALPDGSEIAWQQFNKQFPASYIEKKPYDFGKIEYAITHYNPGHNRVQNAYEDFKNNFKPTTITEGCHFNIENLISAFNIYIKNISAWTYQQGSFFLVNIIGDLEQCLPAWIAQKLCLGDRNLILNNKKLYYRQENMKNYAVIYGIPHHDPSFITKKVAEELKNLLIELQKKELNVRECLKLKLIIKQNEAINCKYQTKGFTKGG